ncbi:hypothetical protein CRUP_037186 [Coryphaenoides rupestris]|nr:hypothetical protein CRUP_037186 [Coryphaenoides rupestris]
MSLTPRTGTTSLSPPKTS